MELAELVGDDGFRGRMRRAALRQAAGQPPAIESEVGEELTAFARQQVADAVESGIDPLSDRAAPVVDDLVRGFGTVLARMPDKEFRDRLATRFEEAHDPAVDRYWRLVWIVNSWQAVPGLIPVYSWLVQALRV
ncbi:hypothetical protein [Kitasatospora sp. NBC_01250]|uniref:hypothetical protein n=1 Tax=Kitasatospora sp. NBC_01250 TaxID=2903571 RepID=UPI002E37C9CC|nr:hypothetical protein [Kitasatospora sp. NBC_01250]